MRDTDVAFSAVVVRSCRCCGDPPIDRAADEARDQQRVSPVSVALAGKLGGDLREQHGGPLPRGVRRRADAVVTLPVLGRDRRQRRSQGHQQPGDCAGRIAEAERAGCPASAWRQPSR